MSHQHEGVWSCVAIVRLLNVAMQDLTPGYLPVIKNAKDKAGKQIEKEVKKYIPPANNFLPSPV